MAYKRSINKVSNNDAATETEVEIELDAKKRVSVRKFNGVNLIDIREFYLSKDGEKLPGKKGISLTEDSYYKLLDSTNRIQDALDSLNGGATKKAKGTKDNESKPVVEKEDKIQNEEEEAQKDVSDADEE